MTKITRYQLEKALEQFEYPPELTAQEKDKMRQRKMKKHDVAIVLLHWFNAITWIFMLATGAALIVSGFYKIAPQFYINIMHGIFSSPADMLQFHIWLGIIWIIVFGAYTLFGYRKYLRRRSAYLKYDPESKSWKEKLKAYQCVLLGNPAMCLDENDLKWLKIRILQIFGKSSEPLPPQGSFNGGQKLYGLLAATMTPVIMLTGLIMAFHLGPVWLVRWAIPIHFTAVGLVVSGLVIHVYMGAVLPEEKPAFFSMITGSTSELFLYKHHFNFYKERIVRQFIWRKKNSEQVELKDLLPDRLAKLVEEKLNELKNLEPPQIEKPKEKKFWNPYVGGFLLGLLFIFTYFIYGRGLGASSFLSRTGTFLWSLIAPEYTHSNPYWSHYFHDGHTPLGNFMIFEVIGLFIGGYISGKKANRNKIEVHKGPNISRKKRLIFATIGGFFMGLGARIARGCTSGQGLTGGITLAVGGWVFVLIVFAVGYLSAFLFRRLWL